MVYELFWGIFKPLYHKIWKILRKVSKKSLGQEMRQKRDISERRSKGRRGRIVCNTSNCVNVQSVRGHLTPKMNIAFFIRNLMLNIFLFNNFFEKNIIFKKITPTMVQICRLENIEHKNMKQVSHSGTYSLSASRAHQSHPQFSFVVGGCFLSTLFTCVACI